MAPGCKPEWIRVTICEGAAGQPSPPVALQPMTLKPFRRVARCTEKLHIPTGGRNQRGSVPVAVMMVSLPRAISRWTCGPGSAHHRDAGCEWV